jgi:chromosome segregation and condensation protein ScpB
MRVMELYKRRTADIPPRVRVTYLTAKVLVYLAGHPGSSNREIADYAGILDEGQTSKLLTRLENLGLIENPGRVRVKGAPNAWTLTRKGVEAERAVRSGAASVGNQRRRFQ